MLDIKLIREYTYKVKESNLKRNIDIDLDIVIELDKKRRKLLQQAEELKAKKNLVSTEISKKRKEEINTIKKIKNMRLVGEKISQLNEEINFLDIKLKNVLLTIPNVPHLSVPVGKNEISNIEIKRFGEVRQFEFFPKPHWELGEKLGIISFEQASKVAGARFAFYTGLGAKLERALINFMLDFHSKENGYIEILPPYIVNKKSLYGTGQLPKFDIGNLFKLEDTDYYLIPTAEVPITNFHREEIVSVEKLPIKYCAYSACFRAEAGAAGKDTRGLMRQHQFDKVELVKFTVPEKSYNELESLTKDAEKILEILNLPYRRMLLCTGNMGFCSTKTYDLEAWFPSFGVYREVSSCSNFEDFQARRMNTRFKKNNKSKAEFLHTLNGSGLAVGRTLAAILENYQQEDGSVVVPKVLRKYIDVAVIKGNVQN